MKTGRTVGYKGEETRVAVRVGGRRFSTGDVRGRRARLAAGGGGDLLDSWWMRLVSGIRLWEVAGTSTSTALPEEMRDH